MMKTLLLLGMASVAMFLTGCRTVAVVDHDRPRVVRSGYYHSSPRYYSGRQHYGRDSRYYSRDSRYYGRGSSYYGNSYYGSPYYGSRSYSGRSSRGYYRPAGATVIVR